MYLAYRVTLRVFVVIVMFSDAAPLADVFFVFFVYSLLACDLGRS